MLKPEELRQMTIQELREKERELSEKLMGLRFQKATGELENPAMLKTMRRDLARVKTILREKELEKER